MAHRFVVPYPTNGFPYLDRKIGVVIGKSSIINANYIVASLWNDWLIRWRHQDLVDDVYDPVRSRNVCECDIGIVDLDSLSDCEG